MSARSFIQNYQRNNVLTADPLKLILMVYDKAIAGCHQRDLEIAGRALTELMKGLRMDAGPIAEKLLAIYQYCGDLARKNQYEEAARILQELRDTWTAAGSSMSR